MKPFFEMALEAADILIARMLDQLAVQLLANHLKQKHKRLANASLLCAAV
jgi:hypothetical protein